MSVPPLSHDVPPYQSPEWEVWRQGGIGASELPALIGEDPWMTERELALNKRGLWQRPPNAAMRWGQRMESLGAEDYQERTGRTLLPGGTAFSARWLRLFASPDRRIEGLPGLVEVKWAQHWTEPPKRVLVQCQGQMHIVGADFVDIVVMGPFGAPTTHTVDRDPTYEAMLDWAQEWAERYIEGDDLPPIDGSEGTRRHLASLAGEGAMEATEEQAALMERLRLARFDRAGAEKDEALVRNLILASLAGHDELVGNGFRATFRRVQGRTSTDWEAVATAFRRFIERAGEAPVAELDAIEAMHTATGEPSRSFRPTWN